MLTLGDQLFLGEVEGPAGGRLERLERGLRDGRPHLVVLDGLERVQEEAGGGRVRGELSDHTLKLLLRALANGLGRARALVTSRFPLVDLEDWSRRGYRDTRLDDLSPEASVAVLRGWGVVGTEAALAAAGAQVGHHALSVAVIGSYLRSFAAGRIEAVAEFILDAATGEDPRAAKLARVLAFYAQRLPDEERELLARLAVFPRGVSMELLPALVEAGGDVAGLLLNARPRLLGLLNSLEVRGLVFRYASPEAFTWTAHPFLRDRFRLLLGCPLEQVFSVVADALGAGLEKSPATKPSEPAELDRYERLIEAIRLAGREEEAFDLYWFVLGGYKHFAWILGEYERGHRILAAFRAANQPADYAPSLLPQVRSHLVNDLALFANHLGRLTEAHTLFLLYDPWNTWDGEPVETIRYFLNLSFSALAMGRLFEAQRLANQAQKEAEAAQADEEKIYALSARAIAAHYQGDAVASKVDFTAATQLKGGPLYSLSGVWHARHHLDQGSITTAYNLVNHGITNATKYNVNSQLPHYQALQAHLALAEGADPSVYLEAIRTWTSHTGEMELIITAHLLAARQALAMGDNQVALAEAELGLLHADTCGYGLLQIELLIALARSRLAWPDPPAAIQVARQALDLATAPECGFAWGEADAAQSWGEAYVANGEMALAQRAFTRALAVRQRIRHPGIKETNSWLARIS